MAESEKTDMEEAIEELLEDPDAPGKGNTEPPQTIDAEPRQPGTDAR